MEDYVLVYATVTLPLFSLVGLVALLTSGVFG